MKKLIFLLLLSTFYTSYSNIDLGVMTGMQITDASYDPNEPVSRTLYAIPLFGLFSKFDLSDNLAIQISPSYTAKKIEANQFFSMEVRSGYIDIPILLSYELDWGMAKPYIFAGPNIGIITNPKSTTYFFGKNEEDIDNDVEDIEYAIKGGLGMELEFDSFTIFGQAFYSHGLNDLYTPPEGITFPENVYLRSFGLQAGIHFPFGG